MEPKTVTIQIPANVDERWFVAELYRAAASLLQRADTRSSLTDDEEEDFESAPSSAINVYTGDNLDFTLGRFLRDITQNARRLVRAIAERAVHGEGISAEDLRRRLQVDSDGTLGGWAASIGFAVKRLRLPKPYVRKDEYLNGVWQPVYRMGSEAAQYVLLVVDEDGRIRDYDA